MLEVRVKEHFLRALVDIRNKLKLVIYKYSKDLLKNSQEFWNFFLIEHIKPKG